MSIRLYHGTNLSALDSILNNGIRVNCGWGGAGTSGVYLSGTPAGALYWAKLAYQAAHGGRLESDRFDREHSEGVDALLTVLVVDIPDSKTSKLKADEEQFEDIQYPEGIEQDPNNWKDSLNYIGDVRYNGRVNRRCVTGTIKPSEIK